MSDKTTATERMRALLDERGVEWMGTIYTKPTQGHPTNTSLGEEYHDAAFIEYFDGNVLRLFDLTPEQAVEATLGPAVPPPEPPVVPYDLLIDELRDTWGIEACWDGLRKFWYLGWTDEYVEDIGQLHDELRDSIVELLGGRCDWVQTGVTHAHMVLDRAASMGRGTCKDVWDVELTGRLRFQCSECGAVSLEITPRFCPNCGRRVES